jgi:hypothetical protein
MGFPTTISMTLVSVKFSPTFRKFRFVLGDDCWVGRPVPARQVRGLGSRARRRHVYRFPWMDSLGVTRYYVRR